MTESATKSKSQAPLRVVKVTPITAAKKSTAYENGDNGSKGDAATQDKIPIEEMVNKGLDLAETGIGLGVNIVARLGTIFKDQVFDKISSSEMLSSVISNTSDRDNQPETEQPHYPEETQPPTTGEQTENAEQISYLFNRLPLYSGSDVSLSFSINNDSLTSEKEIQLKIEPFVGQAQQYSIDVNAFSLTPSQIAIAPVDFEKFVIKGKIPEDAPEDTYYGWIIVSEEQTYQIPVALVVSKAQDIPSEQLTTQTTEHQPEPLAETSTESKAPQALEEEN